MKSVYRKLNESQLFVHNPLDFSWPVFSEKRERFRHNADRYFIAFNTIVHFSPKSKTVGDSIPAFHYQDG
jgi:hypothetical protein